MSYLPTRKLFETGPKAYLLGIGTTWFGRLWPPDNSSYAYPDQKEIANYLNTVFSQINDKAARVMIDTSSSYGSSEEKIGQYFKSQQQLLKQTLIATKWGEEFDSSTGQCILDHSLKQLKSSLDRSCLQLGKVDILYIHRTNNEVLKDKAVIAQMQNIKQNQKLGFIGASFSNQESLEEASEENLIGWCDIIQLPASVFLKRPDLISKIKQNNTAIVVNSPIRKGKNEPPEKIYQELVSHQEIAVILTGTRNHLEETMGYFSSSKSK